MAGSGTGGPAMALALSANGEPDFWSCMWEFLVLGVDFIEQFRQSA
jgi:hypothetical protein